MMPRANITSIPAVPLRTPTHTGDPTQPTLSRQWGIFFEQLVGAIQGIGGMANASSGSIPLWVSGTLAIGSDLAPRVAPLGNIVAAGVVLLVKNAPTGAALVADISYYQGSIWTVWLTLTLPAGSTGVSAAPSSVASAVALPAGCPLRLDITACGTTFPGADLTVLVYF
jgi:hypothetical protein